jgi:hypothetical protein
LKVGRGEEENVEPKLETVLVVVEVEVKRELV